MHTRTPDLWRSFAIGFAVGALGLAAAIGAQEPRPALSGALIPAAEAAPALPDQTR